MSDTPIFTYSDLIQASKALAEQDWSAPSKRPVVVLPESLYDIVIAGIDNLEPEVQLGIRELIRTHDFVRERPLEDVIGHRSGYGPAYLNHLNATRDLLRAAVMDYRANRNRGERKRRNALACVTGFRRIVNYYKHKPNG